MAVSGTDMDVRYSGGPEREPHSGEKIQRNIERDQIALAALRSDGWQPLVIWECALRGRHRWAIDDVLDTAEDFIRQSYESAAEIAGITDSD